MIQTRRHVLASAGALALTACSSGGGQGDASGFSSSGSANHLTDDQAHAFAKQIEDELATRGARVAMVFRTGRPRSKLPEGISYTHGAFWAQLPFTSTDGAPKVGADDKYAVFNLYHGDGKELPRDKSYLHQDAPFDFTVGTAVDDVGVIIPNADLQERIRLVMASPLYQAMHIEPYSLIANPLTPKYQNCNAFMLDVVCAAGWNKTDVGEIISKLAATYKPTPVSVSSVERFFGPYVDNRVKLDDQSKEIVTTTYESMAEYLKQNNWLGASYALNRKA